MSFPEETYYNFPVKNFISGLSQTVTLLTLLLLLPQLLYLILGLFLRPRNTGRSKEKRTYAIMICARNEENVVSQLIESLKKQNYPDDLYDIYLLADNCTDNTAAAARQAGARVFHRHSQQKGKGYALDYLYHLITKIRKYDGYIVFDADNIVDPDFITRMNDYFCDTDCQVITSYRSSKNFASNWLTFASGIWYIKEARYGNMVRERLSSNAMISGTGFLVSGQLLEKLGGWPCHLLTEDIEFNVNCSISGVRTGYCHDAITHDEQAETIKDSFNQRLRWSKGFLQLNRRYLLDLTGSFLSSNTVSTFITRYDQLGLMTLILLFYLQAAVFLLHFEMNSVISSLVSFLISSVLLCLTVYFTERKRIDVPLKKALIYSLLFPVYMAMYVPVNIACLFSSNEWKPIAHHPSDK